MTQVGWQAGNQGKGSPSSLSKSLVPGSREPVTVATQVSRRCLRREEQGRVRSVGPLSAGHSRSSVSSSETKQAMAGALSTSQASCEVKWN